MAFKTPKNLGSVEKLIKRSTEAQSNYNLWRSLHQEAYDFSMPDRETFRFQSPGQRKNRHVYDYTACTGISDFASKVQAGFFPDWLHWMEFKAGEDTKKEDREKLDADLEEITDKFFSLFHQSNFSTEIEPTLKDWAIGTGCIEVEEGRMDRDEPLFLFSNVPLAEIFPERPARGAIKTSFRQFDMEVGNIRQTWPDAELTPDLTKMEKDKPHNKVKLINGHVYDPKDNVYHQVILYKAEKKLLYTQQFKTKRRIIFRSSVCPGEIYGRGPIIKILAEIRSANKAREFLLQNAALNTAGAYTGVDDGIFNPFTVRITPGVVIPVSSNNSQNPSLAALPRTGDIGLNQMVLKDMRDNINAELMSEPLGALDDPIRSASEIMLRHQEALKKHGSSFGRLYSELIIFMVRACVDIGRERGQLPDISVDGKEVKVKMVSPLARQKDVEEFQSMQTWLGTVMQLPEPIVMGSVKLENIPRFSAEKLGVPTELVRSKEEQEEIAQAAAAQAQQQLGAENGQQPV